MNKNKIEKLTKKGWRVGTASDFLNLSRDETAYLEMKLALATQLQASRKRKHLTQAALAGMIHSSQSRVAKMERNDPTVSMDLLVKSLLALGNSPKEVARFISYVAAA
jgi:DNA-binding XRE family transcriptional regulator